MSQANEKFMKLLKLWIHRSDLFDICMIGTLQIPPLKCVNSV